MVTKVVRIVCAPCIPSHFLKINSVIENKLNKCKHLFLTINQNANSTDFHSCHVLSVFKHETIEERNAVIVLPFDVNFINSEADVIGINYV